MNIANCVHLLSCVLKSLWCKYAVSPIGLHSFIVATSSSWHDVLLGLVEALIMYSFIYLNYLFVSVVFVFEINTVDISKNELF